MAIWRLKKRGHHIGGPALKKIQWGNWLHSLCKRFGNVLIMKNMSSVKVVYLWCRRNWCILWLHRAEVQTNCLRTHDGCCFQWKWYQWKEHVNLLRTVPLNSASMKPRVVTVSHTTICNLYALCSTLALRCVMIQKIYILEHYWVKVYNFPKWLKKPKYHVFHWLTKYTYSVNRAIS